MARAWVILTAFLAATLAAVYQFFIRPSFLAHGIIGRVVESIGNTDCTTVPELQACEKLVLLDGLLYAACSTPSSRAHWTPALYTLNATGQSTSDYIATYDPSTGAVTRLAFVNFTSPRGFSAHGLDVVRSAADPDVLFVYAVNHRAPLVGSAADVGADSAVEVFRMRRGAREMAHVATVESEVILTPNDVVGLPDGKSFYFTNDFGAKTGWFRELEFFGLARTTVGYCHIDKGCTLALTHVVGNNGLARAPNDTFYVANSKTGGVRVLARQADDSLVVADYIETGRVVDNVALDDNGALWAAGIPKSLEFVEACRDPGRGLRAPSSALRITLNQGPGAFFGEKYKVEKVFEDDGQIAAGATSVVYDTKRGLLYLSGERDLCRSLQVARTVLLAGLCSPHLTVCKL